MIKKVLIAIAVVSLIVFSLVAYGVYRFFNPFGGLVDSKVSNSYFYSNNREQIVYSPMGNWFELGKTEMNVDMGSFKVLGNDYAKDNKNAYFKSKAINIDLDVSSFRVLEGYVPMDKNHVYELVNALYYIDGAREGFRVLEDADPLTYEQLNYHFAKDKNYVFRNNKKLTQVDYKSFEIINDQFCKDQNAIYHYWYQKPLQKVDSINVSETISLSPYCIRDKENVFFHLGSINYENTDKIIRIPFKNPDKINFFEEKALIKIDDKIYYGGRVLNQADASSFEEVGYGYAKDINYVYFLGKIIPEADSETFAYDQTNYRFYDKNNTFESGKIVKKR